MRAYHFGNFYMSAIQQGIQAYHGGMDLAVKFRNVNSNVSETFWDWAEFHKTVVLLNGGMNADLEDLYEFFDSQDNPYPYMKFHESKEAMDEMLTNVVIILPPRIYDTALLIRMRKVNFTDDGSIVIHPNVFDRGERDELLAHITAHHGFTAFERELISRINACPLAG